VLAHEPRPGAAQQPAEHERDDDGVVELAQNRDEVGYEIERERQIDERERRRHLPPRGHARISQEPLEEDRAVRHEPGDHADIPLPRPDDDRNDQREVDRRDSDGNEVEPSHEPPS